MLGLVGESGSGKSTIGRTILRLLEPTAGSITFAGEEIAHLSRRRLKPLRRRMQLVFQDPFGSLNPRMTVERIVAAPLIIHERRMPVPSAASGSSGRCTGSASRPATSAATARVLGRPAPAHRPRPSADHRAGLPGRRRTGLGAGRLDPGADRQLAAVHQGRAGPHRPLHHPRPRRGRAHLRSGGRDVPRSARRARAGAELFRNPRHPYTEALLAAALDRTPHPPQAHPAPGRYPQPDQPPSGCAFRTRCPYALPACAERVPELRDVGGGHFKACIRDELELRPAPAAA